MGKKINKYLKNAYKVATGQKDFAFVAQLSKEVTQKTDLPTDVVVRNTFFEKMAEKHPEIDKNRLFSFVKTLNIPDSIYQLPIKERLNFFRSLENNMTNIVGTFKKGEDSQSHHLVTSFITSSKKYPVNIKKTAEAVYIRSTGGALNSSSVMQSPTAGELPKEISVVSKSKGIIPPKNNENI